MFRAQLKNMLLLLFQISDNYMNNIEMCMLGKDQNISKYLFKNYNFIQIIYNANIL